MSIRLVMSSDSLHNTTFSCDNMGIHYDVSKEDKAISIYRWDNRFNQKILVGQIQFHLIGNDQVRIGQHGEWRKRRDILTTEGGSSMSRSASPPINRRTDFDPQSANISWE